MRAALPALSVALAVLIPWLQRRVDEIRGHYTVQEEVLYLPSGDAVRRLCPGLEDLMADIYWLRTVQYYGGQRAFAKTKRYDLLEPLVNITVSLDPRFEIAYKYGAIFMSEVMPVGAGKPKQGIALLERGARAMPESWRMRLTWGFMTYLYLGDHQRAASILLEAADMPGAPFWLRTTAASMLSHKGDRATSRAIWQDLYGSASDDFVRDVARLNLRRLDALDVAAAIEQRVEAFRAAKGRRPQSLSELSASGMLRFPPQDLAGVPFDYDPASGRVSIARRSELYSVEW